MLVIQTDKRKVADFQAALYTATSCHDLTLQAMQVQNHVWGPAIMTFATAAANIPINMILIKYYDFWGAAIATSVARLLLLLLLCGELPLPPPPPPGAFPFTTHCTLPVQLLRPICIRYT